MGIFSAIDEADSYQSSDYFVPGMYFLSVNVLKAIETRKKDDMFIGAFKILWSNNPQRLVDGSMDWTANLTQHDAALGNVKALLAALAHIPLEQVDEKGAEAAIGKENPFHGRLVRAEAVEITTKKGNPFTKVNWYTTTQAELEAAIEKQKKDAVAA